MRADTQEYRRDYERGWKSRGSLDAADRNGNSANDAWMDGRSDMAQGLPKWHRRDCPDTMGHNGCDW